MLDAAIQGNTDEVQRLIRQGADVNAKGDQGNTALLLAAANGHEATVQVLLDNGAQVDAEDDDGKTALYCAARNGHQATVLLLGNTERVQRALLSAAARGNTDEVQTLIRQGADVNAKGGRGWIPLHVDAKGGDDGSIPLHYAAKYGHQATVRVLLDNGAHVDAKNIYGKTALDYAKSDSMRQILTTHQQQPDAAAKKKAEAEAAATKKKAEDDAAAAKKKADYEAAAKKKAEAELMEQLKKAEDDAKKTQNIAQLTQQVATLTKTVQQQEKALADKDKVIADRDAEVRRLKQALRAAKKNSTSVPLDPNCCVCKLLPTKIAEVGAAVGELSVEDWSGADGDPVGDGGSCTVLRVESVNWPKDKPRCKRHSTSLVAKVFKTDQKESVIMKEITTLMTIGEHRNVPLVGIHETQIKIAGKKKKEFTLLLKKAECNLWQFAQRQIGGQASQLISTLLGEAARALADFHKRDLLHRDIKPHNFLVGSSDPDAPSIWLSDFGMVKGEAMSDFSSTKTGVLSQKGTLGYLPPEGMQNNLGTQAADVYAFGVTMWEAFVGKRVLPESVNTIMGYWTWVDTVDLGALAAELQAVPNVPKEICEATMTCLAKNPETRPTMASLVEVFETVLE